MYLQAINNLAAKWDAQQDSMQRDGLLPPLYFLISERPAGRHQHSKIGCNAMQPGGPQWPRPDSPYISQRMCMAARIYGTQHMSTCKKTAKRNTAVLWDLHLV